MPRKQLECGFLIPAIIREWKEKGTSEEKINTLLARLTVFDVETSFRWDSKSEPVDLILVLHNLLLRGTPTFLLFDLERRLAEKLGCLEAFEKLGGLDHRFTGDEDLLLKCWKALHVIDPRINRHIASTAYAKSQVELDSELEERFLYEEIPEKLFSGKGDFLIQLFQTQRSIISMIDDQETKRARQNNFREQRADFVLEFPYQEADKMKKGVCLEVDGSQHQENAQSYLDSQRDQAIRQADWYPTIRFPVRAFSTAEHREKLANLERILDKEAIRLYRENFENPLYENAAGTVAMQLMLSPLAIARVQLVVIKSIIAGVLPLEAETWKIGVIERDVPCAHLAVENLREVLAQLSALENQGRQLPDIELKVFHSLEFAGAALNEDYATFPVSEIEADDGVYDLCIDISMLLRKGVYDPAIVLTTPASATIRSSFFKEEETVFLCGNRINWRPLLDANGKTPIPEAKETLTFFLRNIFRKIAFRSGQLPILNHALQNKTVIGLLPTGGGKSLTYQIASLLQPGLVLVIDPIKSLMKDQVDSLRKAGINRTVFINSMLKTYEERNRAYQRMKSGTTLFCFVSPERLQMQRFRSYLEEMYKRGLYFCYGVIDEVHCVSEWGHDFRTSYLSLGENLLEYCRAKSGKIALFGLTATASFDVLADVQRELSGNDPNNEIPDDHIIRHETTNRDEIQFVIEEVHLSDETVKEVWEEANPKNYPHKIKVSLGKQKQERIQYCIGNLYKELTYFNAQPDKVVNDELIQLTYDPEKLPSLEGIVNRIRLPEDELQQSWLSDGRRAALVFAPHRSWYFGVSDRYTNPDRSAGIYDFLTTKNRSLRFGTYMGIDDEVSPKVAEQIEEDNIRNQDDFLDNKLDVMVSTKAFGMGIDKSNIRLTVHTSYPGSIESFVQEAGRAGRDGKLAVSVILFNKQRFQYNEETSGFEPDFEIQSFFHANSFKGTWKEKAVLFELLSSIHFPRISRAQELALLLTEQMGESGDEVAFRVRYHPQYDYIWLNDTEGQTYGAIKRSNGYINTNHTSVALETAQKCLSQLWSILQERAPLEADNANFEAWLKWTEPSEVKPGIESSLEKKSIGDRLIITIPFRNDEESVYKAVARICENLDQRISEQVVKDNFAIDTEEFLSNLQGRYRWADLEKQVQEAATKNQVSVERFLERLSYRLGSLRNKGDTEKALYRLTLIGVVDEYTVDFRTETFEATVIKKSDAEYHRQLRHYLGKFYSTRRVDRIIEELEQRKENTEIQRILNFLVEFIYKEIAQKRYQAIKAMREICEMALEKQDQGNIEMKTLIHLYFNSKYARRNYTISLDDETLKTYRTLRTRQVAGEEDVYNASLLDWSEEGKLPDIDWIFDFMQIIQDDSSGGQIDNLKHLRGACTRLLIVNPENYVFHLLRAYAAILLSERLPEDQINLDRITGDLLNGWKKYRNTETGLTNREVFRVILEFRNAIREQIAPEKVDFLNRIYEIFDQALFVLHAEWTKKFNQTLTKQLQPLISYERSTQ